MAKILVVEDELVLRKVLSKILSQAGNEIVQAEDGRAALKLAESEAFDLIVTDVSMPLLSGFELVKALRAKGITSKVVFVTAYHSDEVKDNASALGAIGFIQKPYHKAEVEKMVAVALAPKV